MTSIRTTALVLLSAMIAMPATAATQINITNWSVGANLSGRVDVADPAIHHGSVYINQFRYTGTNLTTGAAFDALTNCVDLAHFTGKGVYTLTGIAAIAANSAKRAQLLTFIGNTTGKVAAASGAQKNIRAAAMQLGIWEILYENGAAYDVGSGNFATAYAGRVSQADFASARGLAASWLTSTTDGSWSPVAGKRLQVLYSPTMQSQVFLSATPEPASWAMLITGFGLAGRAMRRRRPVAALRTA